MPNCGPWESWWIEELIVYLCAPTNNHASTVMNSFLQAVHSYGIPSCVRSDKGGENVEVPHYMASYRWVNHNSHITGRSTHNQRYSFIPSITNVHVLQIFVISLGNDLAFAVWRGRVYLMKSTSMHCTGAFCHTSRGTCSSSRTP